MEIFGGGGGGGGSGGGGGRHHATGHNERVLVGFGVDSDLKMLLKMKRGIALTCGKSTATSTAPARSGTSSVTSNVTSNECTLTKKSVCLVDSQIAFKVGRKGSLGQMVLDSFPGRCLDKTCTMTNWLRRPLGRPQMEYAALDAIVCYLVYVQNKHNKERKTNK